MLLLRLWNRPMEAFLVCMCGTGKEASRSWEASDGTVPTSLPRLLTVLDLERYEVCTEMITLRLPCRIRRLLRAM